MGKIFKIENYWRNLDKNIFLSFFLLFILGIFFSFSSTSFLADERLKDIFFSKHLLYAVISFLVMIFVSMLRTDLINKTLYLFLFFLIY